MKNKIFVFVLFLFGLNAAPAQSLERTVVSTSGGEWNKSAISLEYTIGETMVGSLSNSSLDLSQGFNQANAKSSGAIAKITDPSILIYPNPFKDFFSIEAEKELVYEIYNQHSQLVQKGSIRANGKLKINSSGWSSGIYQLICIDNQGVRTSKRLGKI